MGAITGPVQLRSTVLARVLERLTLSSPRGSSMALAGAPPMSDRLRASTPNRAFRARPAVVAVVRLDGRLSVRICALHGGPSGQAPDRPGREPGSASKHSGLSRGLGLFPWVQRGRLGLAPRARVKGAGLVDH